MQGSALTGNGLLDSAIEQLKAPLLTIQLMAEAGLTEGIKDITSSTLRLLDDLQYIREVKQLQLEFSPINLSAMCDDIAHHLTPFAKLLNVEIEKRSVSTRPVLSHYNTLERAYENMTRAVLALSAVGQNRTVALSTSALGGSVRLGVYSSEVGVAASDLARMRQLFGNTRRPLAGSAASPLTELFIADTLLAALGGRMRTAISLHRRGFATVLVPSSQLCLVKL